MAQAVVDRGTSETTVAQAFGIPVTTVMEWARRYRKYGADTKRWAEEGSRPRKEPGKGPEESDPRRAAVVESRREHPEHGTRRIRDVLARFQGLGVSETTVRRILHEEGLLETVPEAPRQAGSARAPIRARGAEPALAVGHLHVSPAAASAAVRDRLHGRLLAVPGVAGGGAPPARGAGAGGAGARDRGVRRAAGGPDGPGPAVRGLARPHGLRGGAAAPGHPAHQEPAAPSADAGEDRALLEDAVGGISLADGLCGLRGLPAADRALRPGLQLPPSAPGHRGRGAGGPLLPRRAAGAGGDREGSGRTTRWPWPRSGRSGSPSTWWAAWASGTSPSCSSGAGLMVRLGDVEETIRLGGEERDEDTSGAGAGRGDIVRGRPRSGS